MKLRKNHTYRDISSHNFKTSSSFLALFLLLISRLTTTKARPDCSVHSVTGLSLCYSRLFSTGAELHRTNCGLYLVYTVRGFSLSEIDCFTHGVGKEDSAKMFYLQKGTPGDLHASQHHHMNLYVK